jgi:hypothetical protein
MRKSNEMQIGKAGEYLTCADLVMKGLIAFQSEQGLPYDLLIDTGDKLLRCQVKTTLKPRVIPQRNKETLAYSFCIKRHGKNNIKRYTIKEIDVFALVELETKQVIYLKNEEMPATVNFRVDSLRGSYYDEKGVKDYEKVKSLVAHYRSTGEYYTMTRIAKELNLHVAQVSRMLKPDFKPFESKAKYFSEFKKNKEWFDGL